MLGNLSFLNDSTGSIFHFFVSKTVYEGIQHGDDNSIKNRSHLVLPQGVGPSWFSVSENHSAAEDGDSQEMEAQVEKAFCFPAVEVIFRIVDRMETWDTAIVIRDTTRVEPAKTDIAISLSVCQRRTGPKVGVHHRKSDGLHWSHRNAICSCKAH